LLDYAGGQDADVDVGPLGRPAQQIECLSRPALLLGHQDSLGLLDHGHGTQPGLEPGKLGTMQPLLLRRAFATPLSDRLQALPGFFEPLRLNVELQPGGFQSGRVDLMSSSMPTLMLRALVLGFAHKARLSLPSWQYHRPMGGTLGATRMNDLVVLRTDVNSGRRRTRGRGLK
jgi:hypothetical protein